MKSILGAKILNIITILNFKTQIRYSGIRDEKQKRFLRLFFKVTLDIMRKFSKVTIVVRENIKIFIINSGVRQERAHWGAHNFYLAI